jgi:hypothetical protein
MSEQEKRALNALLWAINKYADRKGEAWRIGEGTEIMDALANADEVFNPDPEVLA